MGQPGADEIFYNISNILFEYVEFSPRAQLHKAIGIRRLEAHGKNLKQTQSQDREGSAGRI